jgi:hypothetical protein
VLAVTSLQMSVVGPALSAPIAAVAPPAQSPQALPAQPVVDFNELMNLLFEASAPAQPAVAAAPDLELQRAGSAKTRSNVVKPHATGGKNDLTKASNGTKEKDTQAAILIQTPPVTLPKAMPPIHFLADHVPQPSLSHKTPESESASEPELPSTALRSSPPPSEPAEVLKASHPVGP